MNVAMPMGLEELDHLLSRWQLMIDLLAHQADMPYAMINRLSREGLTVHTLNAGAAQFKAGDHFEREAHVYCADVLALGRPLLVEDARLLPEMHDNLSANAGLVSYFGLPIRDGSGTLFGTICMLDVVPRRPDDQAQQLITLLCSAIEQDLALVQANQALAASALAASEATRAAELANRAKTDFLARISHELRTPLGAVLGFAQLLDLDTLTPLAPKQRERVGHIYQSGTHLLALIDDMLDVSRIEAGQVNLQWAPAHISDLLATVQAMSQAQAQAQGVTLQVSNQTTVPLLLTDANRLRQVLLNLVSNAIKYNRAGGHVWVSAATTSAQLLIEVRDDGWGLSPEQLAHLFEPFNRLGRENGSVPGTGLGLSLSRQLVLLMGGTISVSSEAERGSCVSVTLPLGR